MKEISGTELADLTFEQISNLGVQFEIETVEKIDKNRIEKVHIYLPEQKAEEDEDDSETEN